MSNFDLENLYEALIDFSIMPEYIQLIKDAEIVYTSGEDEADIIGFNEWFMFNFPIDSKRTRIVDLFHKTENTEASYALTQSFRAFYEVENKENKTYLTDIVTKEVFELIEPIEDSESIISCRLAPIDGKYQLLSDVFSFDIIYLETLKKFLFEQYNSYVSDNYPMNFQQFILEQGHIVYKLVTTLQSIHEESTAEIDEFLLYQATYAFNDTVENIVNWLLDHNLPLFDNIDDENVYQVIVDDVIVAEIEFIAPKFNVLCNNENDLTELIAFFNTNTNSNIHFINKEILTIDSLLGD